MSLTARDDFKVLKRKWRSEVNFDKMEKFSGINNLTQ